MASRCPLLPTRLPAASHTTASHPSVTPIPAPPAPSCPPASLRPPTQPPVTPPSPQSPLPPPSLICTASHPPGSAPAVHVVTVASFHDGMSPPTAAMRPSAAACLLPTPAARPAGVLSLLGPRDGCLWLMNSQVSKGGSKWLKRAKGWSAGAVAARAPGRPFGGSCTHR